MRMLPAGENQVGIKTLPGFPRLGKLGCQTINGLAQRIISNWADSLNPRSKSLLYTFFLHKNSLVKFSSIPEQLDWLFHHKRVMTMHNHGQQDIYKGIKDETFSSE